MVSVKLEDDVKFRLIANPTFEARDISDAFDKLAKHFTLDHEGGLPDDDLKIESGGIWIDPVVPKETEKKE